MSKDTGPYLGKWLNNTLTPQELEQFKKSEEFEDYDKIVKGLEYFHAPSFDENASLAMTLQKLQQKKKSKVIRLKPLLYVISAAASILLIIGLFLNKVTYTADPGTQLAVTLPDGSKINLNAGSTITHNRFFWSNNREVLLEGEGLFTVTKGNNFTVVLTSGNVKVLGTIFNIKSRDAGFEVSCYEGKVQVTTNTSKEKILRKGEGALFKNNILTDKRVTETTPLWIQGESLFISTPLKDVLDELERQYNITFNRTTIDEDKLFSGGFVHNNLSIALESILIPMNIEYTVRNATIKLVPK